MAKKYRTTKPSKLLKTVSNIEKRGEDALDGIVLTRDINDNFIKLNEIFKDCSDFVIKSFNIGIEQIKCFIAYLDGMVEKTVINESILKSLMTDVRLTGLDKDIIAENLIDTLKKGAISAGDTSCVNTMKEIVKNILTGYSVLFIDRNENALMVNTKGWKSRQVSAAEIDIVTRGPQAGFVEDLRVNTALVRRIIKTPDLKMERFEVGRLSKTDIVVAYIKGIADGKTVDEVKKRLKKIDIDAVFESGYIEQLIQDGPLSLFPTINATERPDGCAEGLTDGRILIMTDGTPFVLVVPAVFVNFFGTDEDNNTKPYYATFIRFLRYIAFFFAVFGPSLYIAITTYHQEMIPAPLLITIAVIRSEVPFPAVIEAFFMEMTFEFIREASERLPRHIGQTLSIVGALVIGQAAVQAGLVSQAMIIIVSITAIASFTAPSFALSRSVRLIRFPMMLLGGTLGIFGLIMGGLVLLIHLASIRSFGVPYLSPLTPLSVEDWKSFVFKVPVWFIYKRPTFIQHNNLTRIKRSLGPVVPKLKNKD